MTVNHAKWADIVVALFIRSSELGQKGGTLYGKICKTCLVQRATIHNVNGTSSENDSKNKQDF